MTEMTARLLHRRMGLIMVGFLAVQAISGLLISGGTLLDNPRQAAWLTWAGAIHYNWDPLGSIYRVLLAVATVAQGVGGFIIYAKMRARMKKS